MHDSGDLMPQVGLVAQVRNRRVVITGVEEHLDPSRGLARVVQTECLDELMAQPESVIWDLEVGAKILSKNSLPLVAETPPMDDRWFRALVRSARFSALNPDPGELPQGVEPLPSTVASALQLEEFQLVPVVQALASRRIGLLIADDVGVGKTIEAGLILSELLARRRVRRVLVLCPAALKAQWREELLEKFSLRFDVVDREETRKLRRELGVDANPWRSSSQIICSYHYLRQPDVLQDFLASTDSQTGSARNPWDLLILDEAHNLAPPPFGDETDLTQMLRIVAPKFEHKLFLTATPHNGYTRSFTGLLSLLDPVRFAVESELQPQRKEELSRTMIRRLKSHIIEADKEAGRPLRFASRSVAEVAITLSQQERALNDAFERFRNKVRERVDAMSRGVRGQRSAKFALEILNKRLLSCTVAFADSWFRFKQGLLEESADDSDVSAAERALTADIDDDAELVARVAHAARTVGAWFKQFEAELAPETAAVDIALAALHLKTESSRLRPIHDARLDALHRRLIEPKLRPDGEWKTDERLIVFTEYKTTLDYLVTRLRELYPGENLIREIYGGMEEAKREGVKAAFNDPTNAMRVLVATDAASEGLNLQETARYLHHFDIPWNPARLDQRNGRLDRHGQARNVVIHHFASDDSADMRFMRRVLNKVEEIREDLGSLADLFDDALERRFFGLEDIETVLNDLDGQVEQELVRRADVRALEQPLGEGLNASAQAFADEIGVSPEALKELLETALVLSKSHEPLSVRGRDTYALSGRVPDQWASVVDESLRRKDGALKALTFSAASLLQERGGRVVFRHRPDTELLHLAHPMLRQALHSLARVRFAPVGGHDGASRWTVTSGTLEPGFKAMLFVTVEELAFNELREPIHHWTRTYRLGVGQGELELLPFMKALEDPFGEVATSRTAEARRLWEELYEKVARTIESCESQLSQRLRDRLGNRREVELEEASRRYKDRLREIESNLVTNSIEKLEREHGKLSRRIANYIQPLYAEFDEMDVMQRRHRELEQELENRKKVYVDHLDYLKELRDRDLDDLIPRRLTLRGNAILLPVGVEIRFPKEAA